VESTVLSERQSRVAIDFFLQFESAPIEVNLWDERMQKLRQIAALDTRLLKSLEELKQVKLLQMKSSANHGLEIIQAANTQVFKTKKGEDK